MALTLVVLAAGMGSRYGGLKQLDVVSEDGCAIIDFSIFDAIQSGFTKIIFVIRKGLEDQFNDLFEEKLKDKVEVIYVCQEVDYIPKQFVNTTRVKPWGTGHALLMVKDKIKENFAVINADDFYGREAFTVIASKLKDTAPSTTNFSMVGYLLKNTLSDFGSVSRGQCYIDAFNCLEKVSERTHIYKKEDKIYFKSEEGVQNAILGETIVSMNFWGFTPEIFTHLEKALYSFLLKNNDDLKAEFYIPVVIDDLVTTKNVQVEVLKSNSKWTGITYKEDKPGLVKELLSLKKEGVYPRSLW